MKTRRINRVSAHHWQVQHWSGYNQRWITVAWFIYEEDARAYFQANA